MPKDDTVQPAVSSQQPAVSTPPPVLEDIVLPPMVSADPKASDQKLETNSGSAAPSNDVIVNTTPISTMPRKKYAGGKIIATILGLFLLVGGLGAGVYLTSQNQNINEQAARSGPTGCESNKDCVSGYVCKNSNCVEQPTSGGGGGVPTVPEGEAACVAGAGYWCAGCGGFCLSGTYTGGGCNAAQQAKCGEVVVQGCSKELQFPFTKADGTQGIYCKGAAPGTLFTSYIIYLCSPQLYTQYGYCDSRLAGKPGYSTLSSVPSNFCGVIQIDQTSGGSAHISYNDSTNCSETPTEPPVIVAPTPTAPPAITASCQNVKAYSTTWTELTSTQLTALKANSQVNFCVTGVATGGSFDKAKFMINNVEQTETTTKRPSSNDFCQLYNLPAGVTNYNVVAQIHHVTLGWK